MASLFFVCRFEFDVIVGVVVAGNCANDYYESVWDQLHILHILSLLIAESKNLKKKILLLTM